MTWTRLRPLDKITIIYNLMIVLTIVFHFPKITGAAIWLPVNLLICAFVWWISIPRENNVATWLKAWYPLIIIPTNFSELSHLVHSVNPIDLDRMLIAIDRFLFGLDPTVWMERIQHPIITEYLQLVYTSFYFLPIILAVILKRQHEEEKFTFFIFVIVYGYYASYIGYFLVPAIGPRFTLDHLQTIPVSGLWLTEGIRHTLNALENIQRDAFPSGHTEMTALTMYYAHKYSKKYFYILLVIGTSLIFSTVYLRYHYVIDVVGGLLLTWLVVVSAEKLYTKLSGKSE